MKNDIFTYSAYRGRVLKGFKVLLSVLLLPYVDLFSKRPLLRKQITIWLERINLQ